MGHAFNEAADGKWAGAGYSATNPGIRAAALPSATAPSSMGRAKVTKATIAWGWRSNFILESARRVRPWHLDETRAPPYFCFPAACLARIALVFESAAALAAVCF